MKHNNDFSNMLNSWFNDTYTSIFSSPIWDTEKFNGLFKTLSDMEKCQKTAAQKINGLFDKLTDEEKQQVVDNMNKISEVFSEWFGTEKKTYTVDDFKGKNVNVNSDGNGNIKTVVTDNTCCENKCEDKQCDVKKCEDKQVKQQIPVETSQPKTEFSDDEIIAKLLEESKNVETAEEKLAKEEVETIISVLKSKKPDAYTFRPATSDTKTAVNVTLPVIEPKYDMWFNNYTFTNLVVDNLANRLKIDKSQINYNLDDTKRTVTIVIELTK